MKGLLACIRNGKNLHIYGPEGAGKSALLAWVYSSWREIDQSLIPVYCQSSGTLRQILLCISSFLLGHFKNLESVDKFKRVRKIGRASDIKGLSIRALKDLVFAYLPRRRFCIILDHLECVTPKINGFLHVLYENALVINASRQSWDLADYSFKGRRDYCLYLVPKLRVENLRRKEALLLMDRLAGDIEIGQSQKRELFDEVFRVTSGNPGLITRIFERAQMPEYRKGGRLNLTLIMLDLRIEEAGGR
ncbi:MAG: hypothetical protein P8Y85_02750 [Nitrospirota bacterium]